MTCSQTGRSAKDEERGGQPGPGWRKARPRVSASVLVSSSQRARSSGPLLANTQLDLLGFLFLAWPVCLLVAHSPSFRQPTPLPWVTALYVYFTAESGQRSASLGVFGRSGWGKKKAGYRTARPLRGTGGAERGASSFGSDGWEGREGV